MYQIIIKTTNNYPLYERETREYLTEEMAEREFDRISNKLIEKCRKGEIQDYDIELKEKRK